MDIYCGKCGEPIDTDELHTHPTLDYAGAAAAFALNGCGWLEGHRCAALSTTPDTRRRAKIATAAMGSSEHPDDWASLCDDLGA